MPPRLTASAAALAAAALLAACTGGEGGEPAVMSLGSASLPDPAAVPERLTCRGEDLSPGLSWRDVPAGTRELVVIAEDPYGRPGPVTHWMVAGIPPSAPGLPEGLARLSRGAGGVSTLRQGVNDAGRIGWSGPCPRRTGPVRLDVRLLALTRPARVVDGFDRDDLDRAIRGRVLAEAVLGPAVP